MEKNIELELRAEITPSKFDKLVAELKKERNLISHTKRLSVMFLGKINRSEFDIRIRISSNGEAELVAKEGGHHSHNRIEVSQKILKNQFMGIVKILTLFGFQSKVTERENFVFDFEKGIKISLVKAKSIAYVEAEKMSHVGDAGKNRKELLKVFDKLNLKIIRNASEFEELCDRLTIQSDWKFNGSPAQTKNLTKMLRSY